MFFSAPDKRTMELSSFMETANPPASSTGETIRLPLERRFKLCLSAALFFDKCIVATVAEGLVFIVSAMIFFLLFNFVCLYWLFAFTK
jgi:hypothetical protein